MPPCPKRPKSRRTVMVSRRAGTSRSIRRACRFLAVATKPAIGLDIRPTLAHSLKFWSEWAGFGSSFLRESVSRKSICQTFPAFTVPKPKHTMPENKKNIVASAESSESIDQADSRAPGAHAKKSAPKKKAPSKASLDMTRAERLRESMALALREAGKAAWDGLQARQKSPQATAALDAVAKEADAFVAAQTNAAFKFPNAFQWSDPEAWGPLDAFAAINKMNAAPWRRSMNFRQEHIGESVWAQFVRLGAKNGSSEDEARAQSWIYENESPYAKKERENKKEDELRALSGDFTAQPLPAWDRAAEEAESNRPENLWRGAFPASAESVDPWPAVTRKDLELMRLLVSQSSNGGGDWPEEEAGRIFVAAAQGADEVSDAQWAQSVVDAARGSMRRKVLKEIEWASEGRDSNAAAIAKFQKQLDAIDKKTDEVAVPGFGVLKAAAEWLPGWRRALRDEALQSRAIGRRMALALEGLKEKTPAAADSIAQRLMSEKDDDRHRGWRELESAQPGLAHALHSARALEEGRRSHSSGEGGLSQNGRRLFVGQGLKEFWGRLGTPEKRLEALGAPLKAGGVWWRELAECAPWMDERWFEPEDWSALGHAAAGLKAAARQSLADGFSAASGVLGEHLEWGAVRSYLARDKQEPLSAQGRALALATDLAQAPGVSPEAIQAFLRRLPEVSGAQSLAALGGIVLGALNEREWMDAAPLDQAWAASMEHAQNESGERFVWLGGVFSARVLSQEAQAKPSGVASEPRQRLAYFQSNPKILRASETADAKALADFEAAAEQRKNNPVADRWGSISIRREERALPSHKNGQEFDWRKTEKKLADCVAEFEKGMGRRGETIGVLLPLDARPEGRLFERMVIGVANARNDKARHALRTPPAEGQPLPNGIDAEAQRRDEKQFENFVRERAALYRGGAGGWGQHPVRVAFNRQEARALEAAGLPSMEQRDFVASTARESDWSVNALSASHETLRWISQHADAVQSLAAAGMPGAFLLARSFAEKTAPNEKVEQELKASWKKMGMTDAGWKLLRKMPVKKNLRWMKSEGLTPERHSGQAGIQRDIWTEKQVALAASMLAAAQVPPEHALALLSEATSHDAQGERRGAGRRTPVGEAAALVIAMCQAPEGLADGAAKSAEMARALASWAWSREQSGAGKTESGAIQLGVWKDWLERSIDAWENLPRRFGHATLTRRTNEWHADLAEMKAAGGSATMMSLVLETAKQALLVGHAPTAQSVKDAARAGAWPMAVGEIRGDDLIAAAREAAKAAQEKAAEKKEAKKPASGAAENASGNENEKSGENKEASPEKTLGMELDAEPALSLDAALPLAGWTAMGLCTEGELLREGRDQGHCVGSYATSCAQAGTRIFSLRNPQGDLSGTLELRGQAEGESGPSWVRAQFLGKHNKRVTHPAAIALAEQVAAIYTRAARANVAQRKAGLTEQAKIEGPEANAMAQRLRERREAAAALALDARAAPRAAR